MKNKEVVQLVDSGVYQDYDMVSDMPLLWEIIKQKGLMDVMVRCICKTIKGVQCSRAATKGSIFCSSHQKCTTKFDDPKKTTTATKKSTTKKEIKKPLAQAKKKTPNIIWLVVFAHTNSREAGPFRGENISLEDAYTTKIAAEKAAAKLAREHDMNVAGNPNVDKNEYVDIRKITLK